MGEWHRYPWPIGSADTPERLAVRVPRPFAAWVNADARRRRRWKLPGGTLAELTALALADVAAAGPDALLAELETAPVADTCAADAGHMLQPRLAADAIATADHLLLEAQIASSTPVSMRHVVIAALTRLVARDPDAHPNPYSAVGRRRHLLRRSPTPPPARRRESDVDRRARQALAPARTDDGRDLDWWLEHGTPAQVQAYLDGRN